ncbi:MAG: antibiotic biosynthesis monooxygenase, partial [Verrucomicrobia bacterium]|nr:antibiotic biosynthesis monooxygenase [Verrucomicrobiota bacterium]
ARDGVWGASMIVPLPDATMREYGILRTFAGAAERDAFYRSPEFSAWEKRAETLTEGAPIYRELHGLEAWFRSSGNPPPRWKMAVLTFCGVYPLTAVLPSFFGGLLAPWPALLVNVVVTGSIVGTLTWALMPQLTRLARSWLYPAHQKPKEIS